MNISHRLVNFVLVSVTVIIIALPIFWVEGGVSWLETKVFPARRPHFMPLDSVWIDAPSLPISWHHGWWFGCELSSSGTANYCRLVRANGELVYGGEYLPCIYHLPIDEASIRLIPPPRGASMWLFSEKNDGVIGFLGDGDVLLPVSAQDKCGQVKARLIPSPK
jgi:hypothetical protein